MGITAFGFQLGAQRLQALHAAGGQHHAGTSAAERAGELFAKAAGRAGDQGHTAGKIDLIGHDKSPMHCAKPR